MGFKPSTNKTQLADKANKTQEAWTAPTLLNSWVNGSEEPAGYMKDDFGFVHLKGYITSGIATIGTVIFTLPEGYRPTNPRRMKCYGANNSFLFIQTNGDVQIFNVSSSIGLNVAPFSVGV